MICNESSYANAYFSASVDLALGAPDSGFALPDPFSVPASSFSAQIVLWVVGC